MRERCAEVPEKGLYWTRRGLILIMPIHSDVTRAFEYIVNQVESGVLVQLVPLEL